MARKAGGGEGGEFKVKTTISGKVKAGDMGDVIKKQGAGGNSAGQQNAGNQKAGARRAG